MEQNVEILSGGGIGCDNPDCKWEDQTVTNAEMGEWLNRPCPDCGSNLLTQEDYDYLLMFMKSIELINGMDLKGILESDEQPTVNVVKIHEGITLNGKKIE